MDMDRRGFLECMAWVGTGLVWTLTGGVPSSSINWKYFSVFMSWP